MKKRVREIKYFLFSQHFTDGFRIAATIILPALISFYFNRFDIGFAISLGAACVVLTDAPGPIVHRRNGMLFCCFFIFIVSALTAYARTNVYTQGLEVLLVTFFFSMFSVYGVRAASVGSAAILVMILTMDKPMEQNEIWWQSLYILVGGLWYLGVSSLFYLLRPYRPAQRLLGDCLREVAAYLFIKARFYDVSTDVDENYKKLVAEQVVVNEKQDAVREMFFKTQKIVTEATPTSKRLVYTFINTVDLFEDITATFYDYPSVRKRFAHTGILTNIAMLIKKMAAEIDIIGMAIQSNTAHDYSPDFDTRIRNIKTKIDEIKMSETEESTLILTKILVNLRRMIVRINELNEYFNKDAQLKESKMDHSQFVGHQSLDPKLFWNNLSLSSGIFKHSLRVAIACITGFIVAKSISYGQHSYWIIMTIAFMLKPAFSLTKQRNVERILGTVAGGIIGLLVLLFVKNTTALFIIMAVFMVGTYSYMRTNYIVMVVCTTIYILILFEFLKMPFISVMQERLLDTVIGCAIAFIAGYFLFPEWEYQQLKNYMADVLEANAAYLQKYRAVLDGKKVSVLDYKVARKKVYVSSANLAAAFQRMLSEPKRKQHHTKQINQFIIDNHILFSNIATITSINNTQHLPVASRQITELINKTTQLLHQSAQQLNKATLDTVPENKNLNPVPDAQDISAEGLLLKKQFDFIYKLTQDIYKNTEVIVAA